MKEWIQQIEVNSVLMTVYEWARFIGISPYTLYDCALYETQDRSYEAAIRHYLSKPKYFKPLPAQSRPRLEKIYFTIQVNINDLFAITEPFESLADAAASARKIARGWKSSGLITEQQLSEWRKWFKNEINEIRSYLVMTSSQQKDDVMKSESNEFALPANFRESKKSSYTIH